MKLPNFGIPANLLTLKIGFKITRLKKSLLEMGLEFKVTD